MILRGADQDGVSLSQGGYESEQTIFTVGGDFAFGPLGRVGVLASYAEIENDDVTGNLERGETEIESLKLGVYVATTFAERGFLNGEIGYLTGDIETARTGGLGVINSGYDFDGFTYSAVAGYDLLPDENVSLTPSVGINGATISFDNATEAGGFAFGIQRDDADFTELRGSVEAAGNLSERVSGFLRGTVVHDLSDDARNFTLTSTELGTFGVTVAPREQDRFELAAGADVQVSDNFSVGASYLGDFASGYDAHSARISGRFTF